MQLASTNSAEECIAESTSTLKNAVGHITSSGLVSG